jgi:hypothetical protein
VALPASDTGRPERDCDPDENHQDRPEEDHDLLPSAFAGNAQIRSRTAADVCSKATTDPLPGCLIRVCTSRDERPAAGPDTGRRHGQQLLGGDGVI